MSRRARIKWPGCPFHLTQRGNNGHHVFEHSGDYETYLRILRYAIHRAHVRILSYALMKNHVHIIAVPEYGNSLPQLFRILSGTYAQYWNTRKGMAGRVWQSRYYSAPMSPTHLHYAIRYVEMNPVRAGITANPGSFPWSSAPAHYSGQDPDEILDMEYLANRGGPAAWIRMIEMPNPGEREINNFLRACTYGERPFGDEDFLKAAERQIGLKFLRWPFVQSLASDEVAFRLEHLPS